MINYISKPFKWFFKLEAASGLVLLFAAIIALFISNSNLADLYFSTLNKYLFIGINNFGLKLSVIHWINDALMAIFFFFVTLEIKREFLQGELSNIKQALLPIIAAVGGMLVPALFYVFINFGDSETLKGWAIPSATDIAFSLGVLSLLGKRVPLSLKVFLTALAIIDDLGAIVIIALFYSGDLSIKYLLLMLVAFIILLLINKFKIKKFLPYLIVGLFLWDFTHNSGIHATIAGVLLAMTIPHRKKEKDFSLLIKIEHAISPYVAFGIMPLFAFANAGVSLEGLTFASLLNKVPLGILLGLFVGKQLGVFVFSYISIKAKIAQMPNDTSWYNFYGVGVLTGIGFTMSLFVGNLAFAENIQYMDGVKIGVLTGSLLSTLFGYFLILLTPNRPKSSFYYMKKYFLTVITIIMFFFNNLAKAEYEKIFYDLNIQSITGEVIDFKEYKNKAVLVVNTASYCGFTNQYEELQELWDNYKSKGLVVLGVPSNSFNQEKKNNDEVKEFCEVNFNINFPLTTITEVKGDNAHEIFKWAKKNYGKSAVPKWNFHKILINKEGKIEDTFASFTKPMSGKLIKKIEAIL